MALEKTNRWLVDLQNLTCLNTENQMVIAFEKSGTALKGRIKRMPLRLAGTWTEDPNNSEKSIRRAFIEADEVFYRAYFNKEIEQKIAV